jgi:hypothetical protein
MPIKVSPLPPLNELHKRLEYCPSTGQFYWKERSPRCGDGRPAGTVCRGYRYIWIDGLRYKASRLAFKFIYGRDPAEEIDHINRNSLDDRAINLREATRAQNILNRTFKLPCQSGAKGVYRSGRKWRAIISSANIKIYLGTFDTKEEAQAAYVSAATKMQSKYASVSA